MNETELEHLTNRAPIEVTGGKLGAGDVLEKVQICPPGDWKRGDKVQRCSAEALKSLVQNWRDAGSKDILFDFEHKSEDPSMTSDTAAAGWIRNLDFDPELGLVGDIEFTDLGAEAVSNKRLRFLSVSWMLNKKTREPLSITSVGLTNKPNIPVAPILNKEPDPGSQTVEDKEKSMDKIKEALGLAPDVSEEDVLNAVKALAQKNKDAEQAALEKEAEAYAEKNKAKLDPAVIKAQYVANKAACMALVDAIPEKTPAVKQQMLNKGAAKEPGKAADVVKELNKCKTPAERIAFAEAHAAEFVE